MVGDTLRAERERQGLSIKDIEKGTSIRSLYIDAIEKGDYKTLPGDVYTKGFIRNYANFLKMDADKAVHQYNEENHPEKVAAEEAAKAAEQAAQEERGKAARSMPKQQVKKAAHEPTLEERVAKSNRHQSMVLGVIVLVLVAIGGYLFLGGSDDSAAKPAKTTTTTTQKPAAKPAPKAQTAQPAQQAKPAQQYTDAEVTAKFSDRCWVQVTADGQAIYEGTVEKGATQNWKAKQSLKITAGNAGAVTVTFNGEDQGVLGNLGEVVEKEYAAPAGAQPANGTASTPAQN